MTSRIKRLDTHALGCLDALVSEGHVTRAAHRMGMGQPAMSEMLARLRRLFDDPLLVRTRQGMAPTPRAVEAAQKARAALDLIDEVVTGAGRAPVQNAGASVRIVAVNSLAFALLPKLAGRLQHAVPRPQITIQPGDVRRARDLLEADECDMVIGYPPVVAGSLHVSSLYKYRLCCVVRKGHPEIRNSISLAQFVKYPHVAFASGPLPVSTIETAIDRGLRQRKLSRTIAVRVPDLLISPAVVSETDFIAVLPEPIAQRFSAMLGLVMLPPPLPLADPRMLMIWHERSHRDPRQRWLRRLVRSLAREP
jgi:LysR family transcriptional activator of mexEF-oprN operon